MAIENWEAVRSDFCYISTLLHIAYFSGQCGFNMALLVFLTYDQPLQYVIFTIWLVLEGFFVTMVSTLLLYGMYKQIQELLLFWTIIVLICLILYVIGTIFEATGLSKASFSYFAKLNTSFYFRRIDIIGLVWRVYLVVTIGFICLRYIDIRRSSNGDQT